MKERKCDREGEDLNVLIGSKAIKKRRKAVRNSCVTVILMRIWNQEEDFLSTRDRSHATSWKSKRLWIRPQYDHVYGQDDRVCAYTS